MGRSSRLFFLFLFFLLQVDASKVHTIYWNISNPEFARGDYEISVRLGDHIVIVCPQLKKGEDTDGGFLTVQKDSEMAHMNCVLENPTQMLTCSDPSRVISSNTQIRKYRTNAFGVDFEPGTTHYLLSTSSGRQEHNGMRKRMEGMCKHNQMRMKINVADLDPVTVVETTLPPTPRPVTKGTRPSALVHREEKKGEHPLRKHQMRREFSESEIEGNYVYTTSLEGEQPLPLSKWESLKMNADDLLGDTRLDYIISEHSSSASFSLIILTILVLISLR